MSIRRSNRILGLGFIVCALAACSSSGGSADEHPTGQEVLDRAAPATCQKIKACSGATFDLAYPGGVDECATKTKDAMKSKAGGDLSKSSVCTNAQVDKCISDIQAEACPTGGGTINVPCNC